MYLLIDDNNVIVSYSKTEINNSSYKKVFSDSDIPHDYEPKKYKFIDNKIIKNEGFNKTNEEVVDYINELNSLQKDFYTFLINQ